MRFLYLVPFSLLLIGLSGCSFLLGNWFEPEKQNPTNQKFCDAGPVKAPLTRLGKLTAQAIAGSCSDQEKAKRLFDWVANNIDYDARGFYTRRYQSQSIDEVLDSKKAVCEGYADVYAAMADQAGIKTKTLAGWVKTINNGQQFAKGQPNHVWTAAYFNGKWHWIDATWGAGFVTPQDGFVRRIDDSYFMRDPKAALLTHWDKHDTFGEQAKARLGYEEFLSLAPPEPALTQLGIPPDVQLRHARQRQPKALVTVYTGAENILQIMDTPSIYKHLPRKTVSYTFALKGPATLALYNQAAFYPLKHDNKTVKVTLPAHWWGDILLMHSTGAGKYEGLLAYHRGG